MLLAGTGDGKFSTTPKTYAGGPATSTYATTIVAGDFAGNGLLGFAVVNTARPGLDLQVTTCSP